MNEPLISDVVLDKAEELKSTILASDEYQKYLRYKTELEKHEELYQKVSEFRGKNFEMQLTGKSANEELVAMLLKEYGEVLAEARVMAFMNAELVLCRKLNQVQDILMEDIDLDLRFL